MNGFRLFAPSMASEGPGFDATFFSELADLEDTNFWFRARNALIQWAIEKYFSAARTVLEIGCGTGYVLRAIGETLPAASLVGSELFVTGLEHAAERVPGAEFYQIDARAIPFREEFDLVGAFDVIEHVHEDQEVLEQIALALLPDGGAIITVPQHPSLWSPQDDHAHHVRRYTAKGLTRKLRAVGLEPIRMTSFTSLLLPVMLASRVRSRSVQTLDFDVMDELRQPKALDAVLGSVMSVERALIRSGVSFPAGGSLLVAARRRHAADPGR